MTLSLSVGLFWLGIIALAVVFVLDVFPAVKRGAVPWWLPLILFIAAAVCRFLGL